MKELIDVYFNKENGQIRGIIDETFNINNRKSALSLLIEELKKNSEMDEAKIQELLDPNRTDSPARQLKDQILNKLHEISDKEIKDMRDQVLTRLSEIRDKEIKDIRDYVLKESAVVAEKQKGTTKGFVFEEEVYRTIQILASHYENTITSIGEVRGTESKKGDLLIELENKKRVVIECKDSASYSSKKTIDEINDAIQNRSASFGIFIFAKRDSMPSELCPIKITDKYVITYYDEDNVYFAYRLARLFALRNREDSGDKIDFEKVSAELNALEESFKAIDSVQSKVTTIINAGEYVRTNLKSLRDDIDDILLKLKRALGERFEAESVTAI